VFSQNAASRCAVVSRRSYSVPRPSVADHHISQECNLHRRGCCSPVCPPPIDAHHRHRGRAVWIDPVILRAITISWNNIIIPRSWCHHGQPADEKPLPWFANDFSLPRLGCCSKGPQVTQHQGRSKSERYGHYLHASASLPQRQINEHRLMNTSASKPLKIIRNR
jgi:hypothetical protein